MAEVGGHLLQGVATVGSAITGGSLLQTVVTVGTGVTAGASLSSVSLVPGATGGHVIGSVPLIPGITGGSMSYFTVNMIPVCMIRGEDLLDSDSSANGEYLSVTSGAIRGEEVTC